MSAPLPAIPPQSHSRSLSALSSQPCQSQAPPLFNRNRSRITTASACPPRLMPMTLAPALPQRLQLERPSLLTPRSGTPPRSGKRLPSKTGTTTSLVKPITTTTRRHPLPHPPPLRSSPASQVLAATSHLFSVARCSHPAPAISGRR